MKNYRSEYQKCKSRYLQQKRVMQAKNYPSGLVQTYPLEGLVKNRRFLTYPWTGQIIKESIIKTFLMQKDKFNLS